MSIIKKTNSVNIEKINSYEQKVEKKYIKPEIKFIPLKVEERLMTCLQTGEMLNCNTNPMNS